MREGHLTADVTSFLRRSARSTPDQFAVVHPDGNCTYSELLSRVERWGPILRTSAEEPIVIVAEHDRVVPELYLGVMAAGHGVVPLSSRLPDEAIAQIAESVGARLGILAPSAAHRRASIAESAATSRWITYKEDARDSRLPKKANALPPGTAMVSYTSGTTGEPKGVLLSHTNLLFHGLTASWSYRIFGENVHINPMPLAHFAGASRVILATVASGMHVILPEFSPDDVFRAVGKWHGTHLMVVPTMAADLLAAGPDVRSLGSLTLVYGTAPMPMRLARSLVEQLQCDLVNGYGLTESSGLATALDAEAHRQAVATGNETLLGSVGRPVPGLELKILDESNAELPPGAVGQIALRGPKISVGYLNRPAETASRFLRDGWLLTGDQGRLVEGDNVALLGRVDDMIISGGLNVQPLEIETEVMRCKSVAECAVFAIPSERWGQELRLALVRVDGIQLDIEDLRSFLRTRIDPFKMPKKIFVLDKLPRNALGKLRRSELADLTSGGSCS